MNQKDWKSSDKTFILYHVDNQRNKRKSKLNLHSIYVLAVLTTLTTAAWYDHRKSLVPILSIMTVATALDMGIDYLKARALDRITRNEFNHLAETNDNIKTAIRCLTPRATFEGLKTRRTHGNRI